MMSKQPRLTLAYVTHAPDAAARVLEELDTADAAAFIDDIPARHATTVLSHMSSWSGARCLELLGPEQAAAILRDVPFHDSVGLLRFVDKGRHADIFDQLPARRAKRLRRALTYPAGSVGAWLDPDVPSFATDSAVSDVTRYLRQTDGISHVFLHAPDDSRYVGALPAITVLRRTARTRLADIAIDPVAPLSSRASLSSVATHDGWDRYLMLPVIGRNRVLAGGLTRVSLRKGLLEHRVSRTAAKGSVAAQLLTAFTITAAAMLRFIIPAKLTTADSWQEDRHSG